MKKKTDRPLQDRESGYEDNPAWSTASTWIAVGIAAVLITFLIIWLT